MKPKVYTNQSNQYTAYPLGGMGGGMFLLEGNGGYTDFSVFHRPNLYESPLVFAALCIKGENGNSIPLLGGTLRHLA